MAFVDFSDMAESFFQVFLVYSSQEENPMEIRANQFLQQCIPSSDVNARKIMLEWSA